MISSKPTKEQIDNFKSIFEQYKDKLEPNRKSGRELEKYLRGKYILTPIEDKRAANVVRLNVTRNKPFAEKLPKGKEPMPVVFYVENKGEGSRLYHPENQDDKTFCDGVYKKIFVGIDLESSYYTVEGSSLLWDELCAFIGLDEKDLTNFVCVANYITALKHTGLLQNVVDD